MSPVLHGKVLPPLLRKRAENSIDASPLYLRPKGAAFPSEPFAPFEPSEPGQLCCPFICTRQGATTPFEPSAPFEPSEPGAASPPQ